MERSTMAKLELPSKLSAYLQIMIEQAIERLRTFNKWRTGEDDRTMDEVGIKPSQVTEDIKNVCDELEKLIKMYASGN